MLVEEILQRVHSLYSKGVQSDDSRLKDRQIYNKLLSIRSLLLSQKLNKKQEISQWTYQNLPCVEMIMASPDECPCAPRVGCKILRSKYKIPRPVESLGGHIIKDVMSIDGSQSYSESSWNSFKNKSGSKYTANKPDYFFKDDYLFISHSKGPSVISLYGIFEKPFEAETFPGSCKKEENCISIFEMEFPIDSSLVEALIALTAEELIENFRSRVADISNNANDDISLDEEEQEQQQRQQRQQR